jgi:hypothetical protein
MRLMEGVPGVSVLTARLEQGPQRRICPRVQQSLDYFWE